MQNDSARLHRRRRALESRAGHSRARPARVRMRAADTACTQGDARSRTPRQPGLAVRPGVYEEPCPWWRLFRCLEIRSKACSSGSGLGLDIVINHGSRGRSRQQQQHGTAQAAAWPLRRHRWADRSSMRSWFWLCVKGGVTTLTNHSQQVVSRSGAGAYCRELC